MQTSNREPFLKTQNSVCLCQKPRNSLFFFFKNSKQKIMSLKPLVADDSLEKKVEYVMDHLSSRVIYWSVKRSIKSELIKSKYKLKDISSSIPTVLDEKGMKVKIQNEIFRIYKKFLAPDSDMYVFTCFEFHIYCHLNNLTFFFPGRRKSEEENKILEIPKNAEIDVVSYARVAWSDFLKEQLLSISKQLSSYYLHFFAKSSFSHNPHKNRCSFCKAVDET